MDHEQRQEDDRGGGHGRGSQRGRGEHRLDRATLAGEAFEHGEQTGAKGRGLRLAQRRDEGRELGQHQLEVRGDLVQHADVQARGVDVLAPRVADRQELGHQRLVGRLVEQRGAVDELEIGRDHDDGRLLEGRIVEPEGVRRINDFVHPDHVRGRAHGAAELSDQDVVRVGDELHAVADTHTELLGGGDRQRDLEYGRVLRLPGERAGRTGNGGRGARRRPPFHVRDALVDPGPQSEAKPSGEQLAVAHHGPVGALHLVGPAGDDALNRIGQPGDDVIARIDHRPGAGRAADLADLAELEVALDRPRPGHGGPQTVVGDATQCAGRHPGQERGDPDHESEEQHCAALGAVPAEEEEDGAHRRQSSPARRTPITGTRRITRVVTMTAPTRAAAATA